ncbi:MAG: hypothetical protein LBM27_05780 [Lactobacillaceae bacterium]|jgi:uncharacterized protein YcfJ|nr:hypothetical protein [Lactobacillaceae bacterium]
MIIWRGKGPLVLLAVLVGALVGGIFQGFLGMHGIGRTVATAIGVVAATAANWYFSEHWISKEVRTMVDQKTGQSFEYRDRSSLFFIPNKYWTYIIFFIGLSVIGIVASAK